MFSTMFRARAPSPVDRGFEAAARAEAADMGVVDFPSKMATMVPGSPKHRAYAFVKLVWPIERARDSIPDAKSPSRKKYVDSLQRAIKGFNEAYAAELSATPGPLMINNRRSAIQLPDEVPAARFVAGFGNKIVGPPKKPAGFFGTLFGTRRRPVRGGADAANYGAMAALAAVTVMSSIVAGISS